jgi:hypothetical protein
MSFTFTVQQIYSCTECIYVSTERHFHETSDGIVCPLCRSPVEKSGEQQQNSGMSSFQYRQMLNSLQDNCTGVGSATVDAIESEFESGDDFLDAANDAYENQSYDRLTPVSGVGESTARKICLHVADIKGWENGMAESKFSIA